MRILVPESQAMGSVACIRSLGRAGHHVVAMAEDPNALGFASRFCAERVVQPRRLPGDEYAQWLASLIDTRRIDLVLPSDSLVSALGSSIDRFAKHLPLGPDAARLARYTAKFELFDYFLGSEDRRLRENLPAMELLRDGQDLPASLSRLRPPLFAKFDPNRIKGLAAKVQRFATHDDAYRRLGGLLGQYEHCVIQEFAPGCGVGVFFLRWNGEVKAALMHRRIHEVPHTGGVSSYRETWWDDAVYADALSRIEALDWWGVGMLEYRWRAAERSLRLMELNPRFWGSLHLALFAGVDFPRLLVDAWSGQNVEPVRARPGVRCRLTFPKEVEHLWSIWSDPAQEIGQKIGALLTFFALGLNPAVHSDLWYSGDRRLYWRALRDTPAKFLRRA